MTTHTLLRSDELNCPSCVNKIERSLGKVSGVSDATVAFNTGRIDIDHDDTTDVDELVEAVRRVGYRAHPAAF